MKDWGGTVRIFHVPALNYTAFLGRATRIDRQPVTQQQRAKRIASSFLPEILDDAVHIGDADKSTYVVMITYLKQKTKKN